jgi:hypothetical protein
MTSFEADPQQLLADRAGGAKNEQTHGSLQ